MKKFLFISLFALIAINTAFVSLASAIGNTSIVLPRDVSDIRDAGALWLPPADGERTVLTVILRNDTGQPFRLEGARNSGMTVNPGETSSFTITRWDLVYYVSSEPNDGSTVYLRGFHFDFD